MSTKYGEGERKVVGETSKLYCGDSPEILEEVKRHERKLQEM